MRAAGPAVARCLSGSLAPFRSLSEWEPRRYRINIRFHNVGAAALCRQDNVAENRTGRRRELELRSRV
jgi:hypothetical protein